MCARPTQVMITEDPRSEELASMAFEDTMGALMQMLTATEAVAAIGAELS